MIICSDFRLYHSTSKTQHYTSAFQGYPKCIFLRQMTMLIKDCVIWRKSVPNIRYVFNIFFLLTSIPSAGLYWHMMDPVSKYWARSNVSLAQKTLVVVSSFHSSQYTSFTLDSSFPFDFFFFDTNSWIFHWRTESPEHWISQDFPLSIMWSA